VRPVSNLQSILNKQNQLSMRKIFTVLLLLLVACLSYAQKARNKADVKVDTIKGIYQTTNTNGQKITVPCYYVYARIGHVRHIVKVFFVDVTEKTRTELKPFKAKF
jgi:hypothetical protein